MRPKLTAKTYLPAKTHFVSEPATDDIFRFHRRTSKALPRAAKIFVRPVKQEYLPEAPSTARHRRMESLIPPCPTRFATGKNWLRDAPAMARMSLDWQASRSRMTRRCVAATCLRTKAASKSSAASKADNRVSRPPGKCGSQPACKASADRFAMMRR